MMSAGLVRKQGAQFHRKPARTVTLQSKCARVVRKRDFIQVQSAVVQATYSPTSRSFKSMAQLLRTFVSKNDTGTWQVSLAAAVSSCPTKLLLLVQGAPEPSARLLELLTEIFDIVAQVAPKLDVVPLLPCAGWSEDLVVEMISISAMLVPPCPPAADLNLYQRLCQTSSADQPPQLISLDTTKFALSATNSGATTNPAIKGGQLTPASGGVVSGGHRSELPGAKEGMSMDAAARSGDSALSAAGDLATGLMGTSSSEQPDIQTVAQTVTRSVGEPDLQAVEKTDTQSVEKTDVQSVARSETQTGWKPHIQSLALHDTQSVGNRNAQVAALMDDLPHVECTGEKPDGVYAFKRVAVGGTFDRLHAGHRLLLAAAAVVCTGHVFVGVTADALLANKSHHGLLESYNERVNAVVSYVRAVRPGIDVETGPLSDPKEPTAAELDPEMQALVVSRETIPGANMINKGRLARGFTPLQILVVGLVGVDSEGGKLSSSLLRSQDALRHTVPAAAL